MKHSWKGLIACFLAIVLVAALSLSCGGGDGGGGVTITIGEITDLTGPGSPAILPVHYVFEDIVRYYNDEGLLPGVKLKLTTWDTRYDPSRDLLGYEWCKEHGAKVMMAVPSSVAITAKPFLERDNVAMGVIAWSEGVAEPPGWAFGFTYSARIMTKTLLKWISENYWDYG